ncbi:hypothetical protein ACQR3P_29430 [Rhodococcus sp. IEGM1300]
MDKFKVPSTLHIDAAKALITSIESKIEEGGETALFEIIREMREWASETPSFDAEQFGVYPKREDIESAWAFVARELDALYAHVARLVEELETTGRSNQEHIGRVKARIANIMNLHTDAKAIVDAESRIRTSSEFFLSDGNIDYTRISGKPLEVRGGSVALPYASEPKALSGSARVTILPGTYTDGIGILGTESNGFPGNNHEVRVTSAQGISTDGGRNGMRFIGETDRHADLSAVLDAEAATWFEYERVSMRKTEEELIAKGRGLDYEIGSGKHIRWLEDESDEPLVLSVLIQMDEPTWLNEIDVRPYIPTNYGASAPVVTDVRVSAEYEPSRSILKRTPLDTEWVFRFDPVYATTVIVSLKQEKGYPTDIGHLVYQEVKESEGRRLTLDTTELTLLPEKPIEIEGPVLRVADMGFTVDETATGTVVSYASQAIGSIHSKPLSESLREIEEKLNPKTTRMTVRKIEAMRKMIGLRDIVLKEAVYLDKGELVTKPIGFDEPLKRITLEADASPEGNESGVEVMYHVSIDDGATWHPIRPMNSEVGADAPKMYRIVMEDDVSESEVPIIRSNRDVYSLRFKMTMEQVGVRGQSGQVAVPRTPELYAYKMVVETVEKIRTTKTPNLLPPRRLKGKVIGGNPQMEDVGNGGPTFEEMTRPVLSLEVSKENCHTVPMDVVVKVTHDKPITTLTVHLDGKEVYTESPATKEREVRVSVPVSYFANRSRVSVTVMVSDGIVEERALQAVSIVPCIDVGGRDIDVSASHPQVGETWTLSGFAKSEVDIKDVKLYINGRRIDESTLGHVWTERKRVEFIKVFTSEEVDGFGFVLGEPIEILWIATDIEDQIWNDIVVLQYVDVRPPVIPCGQVTYIGVSYYDWNKGTFQTKGISVPQWDTEIRWFEDGRGIKTLIEWNETLASPVLMVRNGIGETGGVIIGKVEVRYKRKMEDGSLDTLETTTFMEGSLASSMTEAFDLAYGNNDLTTMGQEIHRTGRFTGSPRLMGLNAYVIPDLGEEYRSNVCGTNIATTSFEPEENILSAASVEETGVSCERNELFLVEYYDKTLGRNVLHGQKRDGESPQATIFLPDTNEHEVILKWSDTETGVAILIENSGVEGLIVTAVGVLVSSVRLEARYGTGYVKSVQYVPENETFAVRTPADPIEVKDMLMEGEEVPELQGQGALLFLRTKAREMMACAVDVDDPGIKRDEEAPMIVASTTLLPGSENVYCIEDIPESGFPVMFTIGDDIAISEYQIYHNEQLISERSGMNEQTTIKTENVQVDKLKYQVGGYSEGEDLTVIATDTSGKISTKTFKYNFKECMGVETGTIETLSFEPVEGSILTGPQYREVVPFSVVDANSTFSFKYTARSLEAMLTTLVYNEERYFNESTVQASGAGHLIQTKVTHDSQTMVQDVIVEVPVRKSNEATRNGFKIGIPRKKVNILLVFDQKERNAGMLSRMNSKEQKLKENLNTLIERGINVSEAANSVYDLRKYFSPVYDPGFEINVATLSVGDTLEFSQMMSPEEMTLGHIVQRGDAKWEEIGMTSVFKRTGGIVDWVRQNKPEGIGLEGGFTNVLLMSKFFLNNENEHVGSGMTELDYKKKLLEDLYKEGITVIDWAEQGAETSERATKFNVTWDFKYGTIHTYESLTSTGSNREDEYKVYSKSNYVTPSQSANILEWGMDENSMRLTTPLVASINPGHKQTFYVSGDIQGMNYSSVKVKGKGFTVKTVDDRVVPYLRFKEEDTP